MRAPGVIPDSVRELQRDVSNPAVSAWVAANAGSGKTHVLVQRVINLLLDGVEPEKILCITFTKAAAANMAKRVFDTLAAWTTLDDAGLDKAIRERSSVAPDAARRALARRLFARALDTPGGLKVHTIHAFCTQLLHQFPFEANVAARFNVLDDAEHTQLLEQLTLNVLLEGADAPDGKLGQALAAAMVAAADQTFRDVVREAIAKRGTIMTAGDLEVALANLSKSLGVDLSDDIAKIEAEYFTRSLIGRNGPRLPKFWRKETRPISTRRGASAVWRRCRTPKGSQATCRSSAPARARRGNPSSPRRSPMLRWSSGFMRNRRASAHCSTAAAPWPAATAAQRYSPSPMRCWDAT
jgi:ATP-dependent helicase/nuclease subunit A